VAGAVKQGGGGGRGRAVACLGVLFNISLSYTGKAIVLSNREWYFCLQGPNYIACRIDPPLAKSRRMFTVFQKG
jgi:hypothetical protein